MAGYHASSANSLEVRRSDSEVTDQVPPEDKGDGTLEKSRCSEIIPRDIGSLDGASDSRASLDDLIRDLVSQEDEQVADESAKTKELGYKIREELLQTDLTYGLSEADTKSRLREFGLNQLSKEKPRHLKKLLRFFIGPIQFVMEAAAIIAATIHKWTDFGIICALLVLNAVVGFSQDHQAGSIIQALQKTLANTTKVLRDNTSIEIKSSMLVPGDIVILEEGCIVPADGRIRVVQDLGIQVDQSAITGESLSVRKGLGDILYQSSVVKRGEARMVVIATGDSTFVGRSASLVNAATTSSSHFTEVINTIGLSLLALVAFVLMIVFIMDLKRNAGVTLILEHAFVITVTGVPVGLPAVVTTTMAVGAWYLAKSKAIVQQLSAIECLAGAEFLCTDKTGTLTKNRLSLGEPYLVNSFNSNELVLTACLASSRKRKGLDAIDKAFIKSLTQYPRVAWALPKFTVLYFTPFDPVSKRVTAVVKAPDGERITCVKGAPAAIMQMASAESPIDPEITEQYRAAVEDFASRGFRSIGIARKRSNRPWEILGIMPCLDPLRDDSAETIEEAQRLGLRIKMLTGDAIEIAKETSRQLGLGVNIRNADGLSSTTSEGTSSPSSSTFDYVEEVDGFAEVYPEHKYKVISTLQQKGYLVAMTGDGINDAPSLKKADTGIAVEGATDAARSAADIVFLAPGLSAIIQAIKTSRRIFHRMHAYIVYRIALSLHMLFFIGLQLVVSRATIPVTLLVFIAIFADLATLAIAYDNAPYSRSPVKWNLSRSWAISLILGLILVASTWVLHIVTRRNRHFRKPSTKQSGLLFLEIALTESWTIFITRAADNWHSRPSWQLIGAVLAVDVLATVFCYFNWFTNPRHQVRAGPVEIIEVWVYSLFVFVVMLTIFIILETSKVFDGLSCGRDRRVRRKNKNFVLSPLPV